MRKKKPRKNMAKGLYHPYRVKTPPPTIWHKDKSKYNRKKKHTKKLS